jgi:hypothetical protein
MIFWWGSIDSSTWLTEPGAVDRPVLGTLRFCKDATDDEVSVGRTGTGESVKADLKRSVLGCDRT